MLSTSKIDSRQINTQLADRIYESQPWSGTFDQSGVKAQSDIASDPTISILIEFTLAIM